MDIDPRLRLLGAGGGGTVAPQLLRALDDTHVVIRTGPDMAGAYTTALAAFVTMAARVFGGVSVESPVTLAANWWNSTGTTELLAALHAVRPQPADAARRDIVVTFGDQVAPGDFGIGGDDYTVRLGRRPQPLGPLPNHALGVHAASCLIVSQLLLEVLKRQGFPGVPVEESYVTNLVDYRLTAAPELRAESTSVSDARPLRLAVAGAGSVGSSTLALVATALAPKLTPNPVARPIEIIVIDADTIDSHRNPFRYPALLGGETGWKAEFLAARLTDLGLPAVPVPRTVAEWARERDEPGFDGLIVSSVDTIGGRLDVTDVLARSTLSVGVSGLALHAQREGFADGFACPFCDYVSADPPQTQAGVYAQATGLTVERVLALLQDGARLTVADVDTAVAAGRLSAARRESLIAAPLSDLVRQAYAEVEVRGVGGQASADDVVAVAAPQVSWFAGVVAAAEVVKQLTGLPLVDRRVDVDLSGLPPGLVRRAAADRTGRCLCRSGTRIRWYRKLYRGHTSTDGGLPAGVS
ncbi:hypothetical protein ACFXGA_25475 [Actinosynnema sp. NPDC059335]|uniref:hypothetical protein n=1 Tax=Actinosynnema sp. NPDC059335 TaxID=3346804 RepID=UPI00366F2203